MIINENAQASIATCSEELEKISTIIAGLGSLSNVVPYLTKYSVIKTCGTIEQVFKMIIHDTCSINCTLQVNNYIEIKFRKSSMNPSYDNICKSLQEFDKNWAKKFKNKLKSMPDNEKVKSSLGSLNSARNEFAHGGNPTITFEDVSEYYKDTISIMICLEEAVS